jgi:hypothetical protein
MNEPAVAPNGLLLLGHLQAKHFCDLRGFYEYLFDVRRPASNAMGTVHAFMNQRDVLEVAKFVQWLQLLILESTVAPTDE